MNILVALSGILLLCSGVHGVLDQACTDDAGCDTGERCSDLNKCGKSCEANTDCTEASQICTGTKKICFDTMGQACADDTKCGTDQACGATNECVETCANDAACDTPLEQRCLSKQGSTRTFCQETLNQVCDSDSLCGTAQKCKDAKCAETFRQTCAATDDCGSAYTCSGEKCEVPCENDTPCDTEKERCNGTPKTCSLTLNMKCTTIGQCSDSEECTDGVCVKRGTGDDDGASSIGVSLLLVVMPVMWSLLVN